MIMSKITPAKTLDVQGLFCPIPVFKAKKLIEEVRQGEILEILATDETTKMDIPDWTRRAGHDLLEVKEESGIFKFYIRKC